MSRANRRHQGGFTLIEMAIVISISMLASIAAAKLFKVWADGQIARYNGALVAQYNAGVSSFVSNEPARLANLVPPQPFAGFGNYVGISWLQAPPCAGAAGVVAYLPCGFDPFSTVGLALNTTVAQNGAFILATTALGPAITGVGVDRAMGGAIVRAAEAYAGSYSGNVQRTYGFTRYNIDVPTGNLFAFVDTAVLGEPYLRTDGTNQMTGNLNAGGMDVLNARDMNANRNLNAGRYVAANTSGLGGNVAILNTQNTAGNPVNLAEGFQAPHYIRHGGFLDKPACPPDIPVPRAFAIPAIFTSGNITDPITGVVPSFADAGGGAQWQLSLTVATTSNPAGDPGNPNVVALVGSMCTN
jgi:prepilin-type N-terminal cleavage/methylation domain-containing protein